MGDPESQNLVDTDGDGIPDARLFPTGVYDPSGTQYFAAVRVIDLSGLVNINTGYAWNAPTPAYPIMPVSMVTPGYLPWDSWIPFVPSIPQDTYLRLHPQIGVIVPDWTLHAGRTPVNNPSNWTEGWAKYAELFVRRADNPDRSDGNYAFLPYDGSDELACRWQDTYVGGGMNGNPLARQSRLYNAFGAGWAAGAANDHWAHYARYLTTYSASRVLARPIAGAPPSTSANNWTAPRAKADLNMPLANALQRQSAFRAWAGAFNQGIPLGYSGISATPYSPGITSDENQRTYTAAQLAVNLIDFLDGDDDPTTADVKDNGGNPLGTVMGIERQPFITQAWYKIHKAGPAPGTPDKKMMAFTLYNPYASHINISKWTLVQGGAKDNLLDNTFIPGGGRYVIFCDGQASGPPKIRLAGGLGSFRFVGMDPTNEADPVVLYRPSQDLTGAAGPDVPVARAQHRRHQRIRGRSE